MDAMNGRTFEHHIAKLLRRDGAPTGPFTAEALSIAAETGITVVHRGLLEQWSAGEPLEVLE